MIRFIFLNFDVGILFIIYGIGSIVGNCEDIWLCVVIVDCKMENLV